MTDAAFSPASKARPSDERLAFLSNFHDIVTTIGVLVLFAGLGLGAGQVFNQVDPDTGSLAFDARWIGLALAIAGVAWLASSVLVRRQRRILPGIVLSVVFISALSAVLIYLHTQLTLQLNGGLSLEAAFGSLSSIHEPSRDAANYAWAELPWTVRIFPPGAAADG